MKVDFKKLTATAISVSMLASLGGCAMFDKSADAVLDAADDYATAIVKLKAADIISAMADTDISEDDLNDFFSHDPDLYGDEYDAICAAIESTLAYEIDEDSVEASKKDGEGSVDITFTLVDYEAAYDQVVEDGGDLDAYLDALDSADTQEIKISVNFVLDDDAWLVDDEDGANLEKVYAFYLDTLDYSFAGSISTDMIDYTEWYYSDNGVYNNYSEIELDIIPTTEGQEIEWEFYYEYYLDGALIYTSDTCYDQGYWIEAYYGPYYDSAALTNDDGYLIDGQYRCVIYDMSGNVLADDTCTVTTSGSGSTVTPGDPGDLTELWADGVEEYWYSYADGSGYAMDTGDYDTSETIIEFTCQVYDEDTFAYMPIYYEVWYSATGSTSDAEMVYSATITPTSYSNGYFYEFQYVENGGLDAGSYFFVGASDANSSTALFQAEAEVS